MSGPAPKRPRLDPVLLLMALHVVAAIVAVVLWRLLR